MSVFNQSVQLEGAILALKIVIVSEKEKLNVIDELF